MLTLYRLAQNLDKIKRRLSYELKKYNRNIQVLNRRAFQEYFLVI